MQGVPFDDFLRNDVHDWHSRPYSMHGWRLSGARRVHGCHPAEIYHAGLDYIGYHCIYLEPVIGFELDGEKPAFETRTWTPGSLTGTYRKADSRLDVHASMPDPDSCLVSVCLTNESGSDISVRLTAYGEGDRRIDPSDSIDIDIGGSGYRKNLYEAAHTRFSSRAVVAECIGDIGESHRGGLTRYDHFRVCEWHHARMTNTIAIDLPDGGREADAEGQWRQEWTLDIPAGESRILGFRLAAAYIARRRAERAEMADLVDAARRMRGVTREEVLETNRAYWQEKLAAVMPPPPDVDDDLKKMYYRAWTCVWQLVTPGFDTARLDGLTFPDACVLVTKADHRASMPAEWESGLGALLLLQQDPDLAAKVLDSILAAVEPDGYVPEALVFTKENMLPFITTYLMWEIYKKTGNKEWMAGHFETQKRSIWCHYRHLSFKRRGNPTLRNAVYAHIGFIYLRKIAEALDLPLLEVETMRWMEKETWQIVQNFWDEEREQFSDAFVEMVPPDREPAFSDVSSVQCMVALFAGATDEQKQHMLKDLREKYLVGDYGIAEGSKGGSFDAVMDVKNTDPAKLSTYKHSNFMYFIPGLAMTDPELCREICLRTVRGIALNGDFHEQMFCDMSRKAFGPMSIFGSFAYIISMQTLGRLGLPGDTH